MNYPRPDNRGNTFPTDNTLTLLVLSLPKLHADSANQIDPDLSITFTLVLSVSQSLRQLQLSKSQHSVYFGHTRVRPP
jgi:hypothetical protein